MITENTVRNHGNIKHGAYTDPVKKRIYRQYTNWKTQTNNPNYKGYAENKEKGISLEFASFQELWDHIELELGIKEDEGFYLSRIDRNESYKAGNIRWMKKISWEEFAHEEHIIYATYNNILARCNNSNNPHYKNYGGRGIKCEFLDYVDFRDYVVSTIGYRPEGDYSIDRIDNDGNYCKGNIRWASRSEQLRNRRKYSWSAEKKGPRKSRNTVH